VSAPWPYDDGPGLEVIPAPHWGACRCDDGPSEETFEFSFKLRDHFGEPMPGARCRVLVGGRVVNENQPYADGDAMMHVDMLRTVPTVLVEWAPAHTPRRDIYPYRKSFFVDLDHPRREERARRRLHNLGFSHRPDLGGNIAAYQRQYGYPRITGELDHIEAELIAFHDHHVPPPPKASLPLEEDPQLEP